MTRKSSKLLVTATALVLVLGTTAVAGCGGDGPAGGSSAAPKTAKGQSATIGVSNASLGNVLVDARGFTLYLFQRDSGTTSTCSGACAIDWPPLRATGKPTVGSGAKPSLVASTDRRDGTTQITYNGHPVYVFSRDQEPGDTNGQGVDAFGGLWYAVSPAGDPVTTRAPSSGFGY
jgi:predicted lipoprotein with Yx(FWY)xxD motif